MRTNLPQLLVLLAVLSFPLIGHAQISHGGEPYGWHNPSKSLEVIEAVQLKRPNIDKLRKADKVRDKHKDIPYRFGANITTDLGTDNAGTWSQLENGDRVWRLQVTSPGALTLNFRFDQYDLPRGGKIYIYDADRSEYAGSFTRENGSGSLGVGLMPTDDLVIEYQEPAEHAGEGKLHIDRITHGYRNNMFASDSTSKSGPFGNSGLCNINVNCPEGEPWQNQKRAVAMIVVNGNAHCSGALVNNTSNDGTPYFLTANHCTSGQNVSNWVFYFNHESPTCQGSTGPTDQSVSGADLKANSPTSDFALLELDNAPPSSYDVLLAGWDRSDDQDNVTSAVGIHHPSGDVKKICFEDDAPYHNTSGGAEVWYIDEWEAGVTEGGSSGSPLFNQDKRIIGQLYGGFAACSGEENNGEADWFGRFGVSWEGDGTEDTRLKDWLDPEGSNPEVIDAYPPIDPADYDLSIINVSGISDVVCSDQISPVVTIRNDGAVEVFSFALSAALNGLEVYNEAQATVIAPGETAEIALPSMTVDNGGLSDLLVQASQPNSEEDDVPVNNSQLEEFAAFPDNTEITLELTTDDYGNEISWELQLDGHALYEGGDYPNNVSTTYEIPLCVGSTGCYDFVIEDIEDDGICCGYGQGSYAFVSETGQSLGEFDGQYGSGETVEICPATASTGATPEAFKDVQVFPNPAQNQVNIDFGKLSKSVTGIAVYSAVGRLLKTVQAGTGNGINISGPVEVDLSKYQNGMYMIRVEIGGEQKTYRIMKM